MVRVSPEQAYVTVSAQMREQVESSHSGQDAASHARAWLITGAPRSGKTSLALDLTAHAIELYGSDKVSHIVTNRLVADDANRALIARLTVLGQRRLPLSGGRLRSELLCRFCGLLRRNGSQL